MKLFGGKVYGPYVTKNINRKPYYLWNVLKDTATNAIDKMLPYLVLKKEQAAAVYEKYKEEIDRREHAKAKDLRI